MFLSSNVLIFIQSTNCIILKKIPPDEKSLKIMQRLDQEFKIGNSE